MNSGQRDRRSRLATPEVECIGKGKAHRPYEFGVKVSLATTFNRSKGGQFIAHAKALPGNPYDGHTLATVIPEIETQIGASLARVVADRGYRGHNAAPGYKFKVYISGQRRRVTETLKRELRRHPRSSPSSDTPKPSIAWAKTTSPGHTATPQTPSSPPPATTSAACSNGWRSCCL
jgi:IS5 family transposase